ncbi:MAG TPA: sn-glycerol-3-phosphate ABC transporter ATP-binding protein UgpC [Phycisphaerae bacterium]|nr:sn-glycerol-3-phosphate ABC transporter ATP-binding protein UgpC [Phycisphaerae bacterium]HRW51828.1 sn-glycerol-3-phosphate ABC transporter ATP-binding protein UgpC [Phycisphaerae bacterium]
MASVTLTDVVKIYPGGVKAVDQVSLAIEPEEFIVLVGPSGCGKSTTLRMVAGLEEISDGVISIGDRVVNDLPPKDRDIAMVFQNYALYPHMTVYRNMAFSLKLRRKELGLSRTDIDNKVREAAKLLGISDLLDRRPKALSGGQRQRVAVGRAIVRNPSVFLFDEPLSNLDAKLRVEMRSEIKRIQRRFRTTTIYVTHDQEEAMTLGDRVVVMKDGIVQQVAPPLEIYARPANRFVASFVGMPPMNFLEGAIRREPGGVYFDSEGIRLRLPASLMEPLATYRGDGATLGFRPDSLSFGEKSDQPDVATLAVTVTLVEPLGDRKDVYLTAAGGRRLVARVDARAPATEGCETEVMIDMNRVHVFEPGEMGMNLCSPTQDEALARAS